MARRLVQGALTGRFYSVDVRLLSNQQMCPARVPRQIFNGLVVHTDGSRAGSPLIITLVLLVALVAIIPLAYASPVDPTWNAGIYDAADYDDVVNLLMDTSATRARGELSAVASSAAGARIAVCAYAAVPGMGILLAFGLRGPPAG